MQVHYTSTVHESIFKIIQAHESLYFLTLYLQCYLQCKVQKRNYFQSHNVH